MKEELEAKYALCLTKLFETALNENSYDFLLTILRVKGMSDANWDPLSESLAANADYNLMLKWGTEQDNQRLLFRIGLLMYCHLVEINAVHEILLNLLRCCKKEHYHIVPFEKLYKKNKKRPFSSAPPSAKSKFKEIQAKARSIDFSDLATIIDEVFNENIRNAFNHSDYNFSETTFNIQRMKMPLEELSKYITAAFAFFGQFFRLLKGYQMNLGKNRRYHKLPQYETLEILRADNGLLGFKMHFSNGHFAHFQRTDAGVTANNLLFEESGEVNFFIGDLGKQEKKWKVNGVEVTDWDAINSL